MQIRPANSARDAGAIAAIYAPFVTDTAVSFEDVPPSADEMASRIERLTVTHPWLVAEDRGEILGYAYACPHRERAAYRWATEVTVYVDPRHHRRGAGRALYEALLAALADQGYRTALAVIGLPNDASVGLHEACGFQPVGVLRRIGFKFDRWWDVGWWQLELTPAPNRPAP
ncbi:MAG TPA: arsinothricin resistance N-acetyltransferase ArsN1 family B [Solirubrobacteraceae bacterium]|nr:arsinothricin resistance N-acetyltransferase ArsN1 family B [Solirubrobacteraceae bacterium]